MQSANRVHASLQAKVMRFQARQHDHRTQRNVCTASSHRAFCSDSSTQNDNDRLRLMATASVASDDDDNRNVGRRIRTCNSAERCSLIFTGLQTKKINEYLICYQVDPVVETHANRCNFRLINESHHEPLFDTTTTNQYLKKRYLIARIRRYDRAAH